ncbi:hypothetical protein QJQ45_016391 [Haematococcus lacustris]|nr:hypothetical protein QJQ45_016391 [Haematococcus lacustris]
MPYSVQSLQQWGTASEIIALWESGQQHLEAAAAGQQHQQAAAAGQQHQQAAAAGQQHLEAAAAGQQHQQAAAAGQQHLEDAAAGQQHQQAAAAGQQHLEAAAAGQQHLEAAAAGQQHQQAAAAGQQHQQAAAAGQQHLGIAAAGQQHQQAAAAGQGALATDTDAPNAVPDELQEDPQQEKHLRPAAFLPWQERRECSCARMQGCGVSMEGQPSLVSCTADCAMRHQCVSPCVLVCAAFLEALNAAHYRHCTHLSRLEQTASARHSLTTCGPLTGSSPCPACCNSAQTYRSSIQ